MREMIFILYLFLSITAYPQRNKPTTSVKKVKITYKNKQVEARELTVASEIPIDIYKAWQNVKTPALLQFVSKGMLRFKFTDGELPEQWIEGHNYKVKMRLFGVIPFGGTHHLHVKETNEENFQISTEEWDRTAKVWNHQITLRETENERIYYEDKITIYGGMLTGLITNFAIQFYKHRQKRWQLVAHRQLNFSK